MKADAKRSAWILRVSVAHKRLLVSIAVGIAVALLVPVAPITRILIGWDAGVLLYLVAAVAVIRRCNTVAQMRRNSSAQDEGALAILILTTFAAMASLVAIFAELAMIERSDRYYPLYVTLAIVTVALSWTFIHTIFALHYAHEFYGEGTRKNGLRFPEDDKPDYWDFVYFAFVIGMTFQVSDVAVTHKAIRRLVVSHGALSFLFVTAILAMTVNIAAGIIQK